MRRLIKVCTVCLNYKKLRVKWNSLKSPLRIIFPLRDNSPNSDVSTLIQKEIGVQEADRKSQKLSPFSKMAEIYLVYPFILKDLDIFTLKYRWNRSLKKLAQRKNSSKIPDQRIDRTIYAVLNLLFKLVVLFMCKYFELKFLAVKVSVHIQHRQETI